MRVICLEKISEDHEKNCVLESEGESCRANYVVQEVEHSSRRRVHGGDSTTAMESRNGKRLIEYGRMRAAVRRQQANNPQ